MPPAPSLFAAVVVQVAPALLLLLTWFGAVQGAVAQRPESVHTFDVEGMVHVILQDRQGLIWIVTEGGLVRHDGYTTRSFTSRPDDPASLPTNILKDAALGPDGRLWLAADGRDLVAFDPETAQVEIHPLPDSLLHSARALTVDLQGAVWISTRRRAILRYDPKRRIATRVPSPIRPYPDDEAMVENNVRLATSSSGQVWAVNPEHGLVRLSEGGARRSFGRTAAFRDEPAAAVAPAEGDDIWVATDRALYRYDASTDRVRHVAALPLAHDQPGTLIRSIAVDQQQNVWLDAGSGGIFRFNAVEGMTSVPVPPMEDSRLGTHRPLYVDRSGVLWRADVVTITRIALRTDEITWYGPQPDAMHHLDPSRVLAVFEADHCTTTSAPRSRTSSPP